MTGLGLLFSMHYASGSYALAGVATGVFAAAEAAAGPQIARLVDRCGQTVTVLPAVAIHVGAVAVGIISAQSGSIVVTLVAVAIAGAVVPQPGALSAARWSHLISEPPALRTAFSLEASVNDLVFLSGPNLVTLASNLITPWAGSAAAAFLLTGGCVALAAQRSTAPPPRRAPRRGSHGRNTSLLAPAFLGTLGVNLGLGCFFGAVPLLVTAAAAARGLQPITGLVLALSSAASIIGGLRYGSLRRAPRPQLIQLIASAVLALAVVIGAIWPTLLGLAAMLVIGGTAIAPLLASSSQIVQASIAAGELTQGFTWINTASAAGIAGSAAVTGTLITHGGVGAATLQLIALVLIALVCAALSLTHPFTR
jgi:hypothetical protein